MGFVTKRNRKKKKREKERIMKGKIKMKANTGGRIEICLIGLHPRFLTITATVSCKPPKLNLTVFHFF